MAAGLWVMFLVFYRQLDKPEGRREGPISTSIGVEWGIFVAFLLGALLAYAGFRIRAVPHPRAGGDDAPTRRRAREPRLRAPAPRRARRRRRAAAERTTIVQPPAAAGRRRRGPGR